MANDAKKAAADSPLVELTEDAKKQLEGLDAELDRAEKDLAALEELGIDVSRLRDKIEWGRHAKEVILKTLT